MHNLAIVATTNRANFIYRLIAYYNNTNIKLIIIHACELEEKLVSTANKNIEFYYYKEKYVKSVFYGISKVKEKYCCVLHDDDLILIDELNNCLNNLKNNKDILFSQGYHSHFYINRNNEIIAKEGLDSRFHDLINFKDKNNLYLRLSDSLIFSKYLPKMHAVTETKILLKIFESSTRLGEKIEYFNSPCNQEFYFEILSCILGKLKFEQKIYMVRDNEHETSYHIHTNKKKELWFEGIWKEKHYRKIIVNEIKNFQKDIGHTKNINFNLIQIILSIFTLKIYLNGNFKIFKFLRNMNICIRKIWTYTIYSKIKNRIFREEKEILLDIKQKYI